MVRPPERANDVAIVVRLLMFSVLSDSGWPSVCWMAERLNGVLGLACVAIVCCMMFSGCTRCKQLLLWSSN
jgi:hypothetical protein